MFFKFKKNIQKQGRDKILDDIIRGGGLPSELKF